MKCKRESGGTNGVVLPKKFHEWNNQAGPENYLQKKEDWKQRNLELIEKSISDFPFLSEHVNNFLKKNA